MKYLFFACLAGLILSCSEGDDSPMVPQPQQFVAERLSAAVTYLYEDERVKSFLEQPGEAYVSGYFRFDDNLPEDVIFGFDLEWFEGLDNPLYVPGGDWMSFAGFTQNGFLWVPHGTEPNREGIPTAAENFAVFNLGIDLLPGIWYKMQINCDFGKREFVSVTITGGDIDTEYDLTGLWLEYPNYVAFDKPALTAYCFASRSVNLADNYEGDAFVFFDDIEVGILTENGFEIIKSDGFENPNSISLAPYDFNASVNPLSQVPENIWYSENTEAILQFTDQVARTGRYAMRCNATLID